MIFQVEAWSDCKSEIIALARQHHVECRVDSEPFELDEQTYDALEELGKLNVFTARDEGELVGYLVNIVTRHMHFNKLVSQHSGWFVRPDKRGIGYKLLKLSEDGLRAMGVQKMYGSHMTHKDASAAFNRLGWEAKEIHYTKEL
jgi:L-amino acid N-acyltransferase YncA